MLCVLNLACGTMMVGEDLAAIRDFDDDTEFPDDVASRVVWCVEAHNEDLLLAGPLAQVRDQYRILRRIQAWCDGPGQCLSPADSDWPDYDQASVDEAIVELLSGGRIESDGRRWWLSAEAKKLMPNADELIPWDDVEWLTLGEEVAHHGH